MKKLFARKAVTEEQVDEAEERLDVAASHVRVEEAELRYERFKLSEAKVTTSVPGLVTKRWVDPGDALVARAAGRHRRGPVHRLGRRQRRPAVRWEGQ